MAPTFNRAVELTMSFLPSTFPRTTTIRLGLGYLALLVMVFGCGRQDRLVDVRGIITYDGKPVEDGIISFVPEDGLAATAEAVISGGHYAAHMTTGRRRVAINGFKVVGQRQLGGEGMGGPIVNIRQQVLPERFNTNTSLSCDVTPAVHTYDFSLEGNLSAQ